MLHITNEELIKAVQEFIQKQNSRQKPTKSGVQKAWFTLQQPFLLPDGSTNLIRTGAGTLSPEQSWSLLATKIQALEIEKTKDNTIKKPTQSEIIELMQTLAQAKALIYNPITYMGKVTEYYVLPTDAHTLRTTTSAQADPVERMKAYDL